MPRVVDAYAPPPELSLGTRLNARLPADDQRRQRREVEEVLSRLRRQPGLILADEVGMGKTFVALAVSYSVAVRSPKGPAILMVPANLVDKWEQDLKVFCELYLDGRRAVNRDSAERQDLMDPAAVRYAIARHSVELMKLLDDPARERCHLILLAQGAMARRQTDRWIRLALIAEALRRHGRGNATRLLQVRREIHRFLGRLLNAIGAERAHDLREEIWQQLLRTDVSTWKDGYNDSMRDRARHLRDDPVPKSVVRALARVDLRTLSDALKDMPVRARGGESRVAERIAAVRDVLRDVENELWKDLLAETRWRSPLLVMDEAHHLKNPNTALARQLQSRDLEEDLRIGDGAMARAFERMLFLTATPFQLGHAELVKVLERFGDVRWDDAALGDQSAFTQRLHALGKLLNDSQRAAIALQRAWQRLRPEDAPGDLPHSWDQLCARRRDDLTFPQRAAVEAFEVARRAKSAAETALRPWIVRHNKGTHWQATSIVRRRRWDGETREGQPNRSGLSIPPHQLLPFFLAARSAVDPGKDLLGEALCSSFEAFRLTRQGRAAQKDEVEEGDGAAPDLSHSKWYLSAFDRALQDFSSAAHPKVSATVQRVADLWEAGEKVLVFAFYRHTCRALRVHISDEIERRMVSAARRRLSAQVQLSHAGVQRLIERVQRRYFDSANSPGRKAVDSALAAILDGRETSLVAAAMHADQRAVLLGVMRRFLRANATVARCFPLGDLETLDPVGAVDQTLRYADHSGLSWLDKFDGFISFLTSQCSSEERKLYLEAAHRLQTGGIRVEGEDEEDFDASRVTLANVQVATGTTRRETRTRLMRAFNTPFFPDILVCSEVMGEGVDLQRFCRQVIHHDLAWNPSTIEQRTGRVDRLGCKAEGRFPIDVYLPFLAGAADERQYRVMSDREQWFRVVMGQDEVARLITPDSIASLPLPDSISHELTFNLGIRTLQQDDVRSH
jgi:ERCC4-related helicase